ncbi:MAG: hypothetical protein ACYC8T_38120 [Myxococcaceae bacterium]
MIHAIFALLRLFFRFSSKEPTHHSLRASSFHLLPQFAVCDLELAPPVLEKRVREVAEGVLIQLESGMCMPVTLGTRALAVVPSVGTTPDCWTSFAQVLSAEAAGAVWLCTHDPSLEVEASWRFEGGKLVKELTQWWRKDRSYAAMTEEGIAAEPPPEVSRRWPLSVVAEALAVERAVLARYARASELGLWTQSR